MSSEEEEILAVRQMKATPIGTLTVVVGQNGVNQILFGAFEVESAPEGVAAALLEETIRQLDQYFSGNRTAFDLPLDWSGLTAYQEQVLQACYAIPYGQVTTYGQLAAQTGKPKAARAVGGFMASNRLPILIPCHRVVASDRSLHGYAGAHGLADKAWLLSLEGHRIELQKLV